MQVLNFGVTVPDNATNGDVIKAIFNVKVKYCFEDLNIVVVTLDDRTKIFNLDWWESKYKVVE